MKYSLHIDYWEYKRSIIGLLNNQILPHRDKAMAETREYHRNVAWTQVSWHSKNGTKPSFPVRTKGNASDCLISKDQIGRMYFQTPFPVPSLKQLLVKFLHHLRSFCSPTKTAPSQEKLFSHIEAGKTALSCFVSVWSV